MGDAGAFCGWDIDGWRRRVLELRFVVLVMEEAVRVCPRGEPMLLGVAEPVEAEEARIRRVLGCLDIPLDTGSVAVLVVVLVEIL